MNNREVLGMVARYLFLLIIAISGLKIFYSIFTPLTFEPVSWAFRKLYNAIELEGNIIFVKGYYASIVQACVAGAAYYLLLILNMTTPMPVKKRIKSILFLLASFLVLNVLRIVIFIKLVTVGYEYFDVVHTLTWYFASTLLVVLVWFANVWLFKIDGIPIYTDAMNIFQDLIKKDKKK